MPVPFDTFYLRAKQRYGDLADDYIASEYERLTDTKPVLVSPEFRDHPLGDPGAWTDIKRGVGRGVGGLRAGVAGLGLGAVKHLAPSWVSEEDAIRKLGFDPYQAYERAQAQQQRNLPAASIAGDVYDKERGLNWDLLSRPDYWASAGAEAGTSILPGLAAGLATGGLGGVAVFGGLAGAQEAAPDYAENVIGGMNPNEALARAVPQTIAVGALNALPFAGALGKVPGFRRGLGRIAGTSIGEAGTEWLEEPVTGAIQAESLADIPGEVRRRAQEGLNVVPGSLLAGLFLAGSSGGQTQKPQSAAEQFRERLGVETQEAQAPQQPGTDLTSQLQGIPGLTPAIEPAVERRGLGQGYSTEIPATPGPVDLTAQAGVSALPAEDLSTIDSVIDSFTKRWGANAPKLGVVDSDAGLSEEKLNALGSGILGFTDFSTGEIGVVRENILKEAQRTGDSVATVTQRVLTHESVGHYGMQRVLGNNWDKLLTGIPKLAQIDGTVKTAWDDVGKRYQGESQEVLAAETLARMAEMNPQHSLVQRAFAQIREGLRSMGFNIEYSDNDIIGLLRRAAKHNEGGVSGTASQDGILASRSAPVFFSGLERLVGEAQAPKATGEQWANYLRNKGAKSEEMKWTGADEWLREQKGAVSKDALADYVRSHKVEVKEITLESKSPYNYQGNEWQQAINRAEASGNFAEAERINRAWEGLDEKTGSTAGQPKFSQWQVPGGENYRELLLTLPSGTIESPRLRELRSELETIVSMPVAQATYKGEERTAAYDRIYKEFARLGGKPNAISADFKSGHFGEPNVLAHVRFNDRTDANGKKTLFIEEIQSDWAQKGRKEGFAGKGELTSEELDRKTELAVRSARGELGPAERAEYNELQRRIGSRGIPAAPFVGKTEGWSSLAMKRMIRWAAEHGYDQIAWTPGNVQADRYDLSKHISEIHFSRTSGGVGRAPSEMGPGTLEAYNHNGKLVIDQYIDDPADIEKYVGKEAAQKLIEQKGSMGSRAGLGAHIRKLTGVDLKVGGEGMRGFYDNILVGIANKLGKKFGTNVGKADIESSEKHYGYRVTTAGEYWETVQRPVGMVRPKNMDAPIVVVDVGDGARKTGPDSFPSVTSAKEYANKANLQQGNITAVHSLPITPAMRESVMQGQPMFAARPSEQIQPQTPQKIEVGGGTYSVGTLSGVSPQITNIVLDVMKLEEPNIAKQRGGEMPITWDQTETEAQELLQGQFGKVFNSLVNRIPRSTANAATLKSYAKIVLAAGKEVSAAVDQYNRTASAQDLARLSAVREQLGVALAPFMGYRTEAGRALNILKQVQSDFADAQKIFEALGDGHVGAMQDFARQVKDAGSVAEVLEITRASYKPTLLDQFREYWINALLSGPWTHVANTFSNTMFTALESAAELATSLVSRDVSTRAALARFTGMLSGVQMGIANAGKAFVTEQPQLDPRMQVEARKYQAIPGRVGRVVRIPGRALMAEDEFAKAISYTGELHRLAMDEAIKQNPENPHAVFQQVLLSYANNREVQERAKRWADRQTFQTALGPLGRQAMNLREKVPVLGWLLVPFVRTPTNIVKRFAEYTPAGMVMPSVLGNLKAGGREGAIAKGRMALGTAAMAGVANLVLQGLMTGAGPDDKNERELWLRTGRKPYSVKVGDQWVKYNRFEPLGMLLGISADMTEIGKSLPASNEKLEKVSTLALASFMKNLGDKTFLRGITDFTQAAVDPERYMASWASGMVGTIVPNILAQTARAIDPYVRDARSTLDQIKSRIPGLREDLPAKLDIAGQPIERSVFEPAASSEQVNDPLAETMLRLDVTKGSPSRLLTISGRRYEMDSSEYEDYKAFMQQARWNVLTPIVSSPGFANAERVSPLQTKDELERLWSKIGSDARDTWLLKHPEVIRKLARQTIRSGGSQYIQ